MPGGETGGRTASSSAGHVDAAARRRHRRQEMKIDFRACQDATVTQWCGRIEGRIGGSEIRIQLKLKHEADT